MSTYVEVLRERIDEANAAAKEVAAMVARFPTDKLIQANLESIRRDAEYLVELLKEHEQ